MHSASRGGTLEKANTRETYTDGGSRPPVALAPKQKEHSKIESIIKVDLTSNNIHMDEERHVTLALNQAELTMD